MDKGFFGDLFDFNRDGEMDTFERAYEFAVFHEMMDEMEREEAKEAGLDPYEYGDD